MKQVLVSWMVLLVVLVRGSYAKCAFEAIFNFGDSNSDTGGFYAAFPSQPSPHGMTYFGKPTGRATDGRLYIDFFGKFLCFSSKNDVINILCWTDQESLVMQLKLLDCHF